MLKFRNALVALAIGASVMTCGYAATNDTSTGGQEVTVKVAQDMHFKLVMKDGKVQIINANTNRVVLEEASGQEQEFDLTVKDGKVFISRKGKISHMTADAFVRHFVNNGTIANNNNSTQAIQLTTDNVPYGYYGYGY